MSRLAKFGLVPGLLLVASAALLAADDWPQFRGPKRDNVSTEKGLLPSWPKGGPKVVWKGTGVGDGFSSVAVAGDRVYTMGDKGGASHAFALDRKTGKLLWETKIGKAGGNYSGTRCTPTVDGDNVYVLGQFGDFACLAAKDGKAVWTKNFKTDFGGASGGWNFTESPLIDGDKVVVTPGGSKATMVALEKATGKEIWRSPIGHTAGYSSIVISNGGGTKQYVQLTSMGTVGVNAETGKLLWTYDKFARNTANIPTPIVLGDQIFTSAGYGRGGALLTLSSGGDGAVNAKEEYYQGKLTNKHGGVLIVGDYVYGDTDDRGSPFCAEWKTGNVVWTRERKGTCPGSGSASVTYADDRLYVRYQNGWMALVKAGGKKYEETGSFKIENSNTNSWAHPVVVDGKMYIREKDIVWCYDVKGKAIRD